MRTRVANAALAILVYLALLILGSALLPDGTFQDWIWPGICGVLAACLYLWLDRRRMQRGLVHDFERYMHENTQD